MNIEEASVHNFEVTKDNITINNFNKFKKSSKKLYKTISNVLEKIVLFKYEKNTKKVDVKKFRLKKLDAHQTKIKETTLAEKINAYLMLPVEAYCLELKIAIQDYENRSLKLSKSIKSIIETDPTLAEIYQANYQDRAEKNYEKVAKQILTYPDKIYFLVSKSIINKDPKYYCDSGVDIYAKHISRLQNMHKKLSKRFDECLDIVHKMRTLFLLAEN